MLLGFVMADSNLRDFYGRIYRIQKRHREGGGFEAAGTLGRAYFQPPPSRSHVAPVLRAIVMVFAAVTLVKVMILSAIGPHDYADRLSMLRQGDSLDRAGAVVMVADPVTTFLAGKIAALRG